MKYRPEATVIKMYCIPVPLISEQWHPKPGQTVFRLFGTRSLKRSQSLN